MAEDVSICRGIRMFCLPSSLLPLHLSYSCSSRLRESAVFNWSFCFLNERRSSIPNREFQENILVLPKEMTKATFGGLCFPYTRLHSKTDDQTQIDASLHHWVAIPTLETVWENYKHWKKNESKNWTNLDFNTFYCTCWQEEKNWQISSMKMPFLPYRTLCFNMSAHHLFHFLIVF